MLGWTVAESTDDRVELVTASSYLRASLVASRDEGRVSLTTSLTYLRPAIARPVWLAVGPLHRLIAPVLLRRATRPSGAPPSGASR